MRNCVAFLAAGLVLLNCWSLRADWPQFRGPEGTGHSAEVGLPLTWSDTENIAWRTELPGSGWSSPVVVDGRVYLTAAVPVDSMAEKSDLSLRTMCVDSKSGALLWNTEVFLEDAETAPGIHQKNSHASPTPIVEGDRLYVHFGHEGTACLDPEGNVVWRNGELRYPPVHGNGGSPTLWRELLIFSCDGGEAPFVAALNKQTGELVWKHERGVPAEKTFSFCTPQVIEVNGREQVVIPGSNVVSGLDPATGAVIWFASYDGYSVIPRPVYAHGLIFISTGYNSPVVMAIRPDGAGDVTETHVAWKHDKAGPNTPSLLVVGDELYIVSDNGVASCLDAVTGTQHWQKRLGGNYSASPLFAEGRIYFQDEQGQTTVIAPGISYQQLAKNSLTGRTLASYAVAEQAIFLRSDTALYRIQVAQP
jgi:outer membrane protein assembly factor BamB